MCVCVLGLVVPVATSSISSISMLVMYAMRCVWGGGATGFGFGRSEGSGFI